jgi:hypothetical protein
MIISASTRIYIAPYHAAKDDSSGSPCGSTIRAFKNTVAQGDWPLDYGDDPSFYMTRKFGVQLSWGVCRTDVRNQLKEGDVVVFFSYLKFEDGGDSEYRLCSLATVESRVSQTEIWEDPKLRRFRKHFNLLIRPVRSKRGGWEHYEPTLSGDGIRVHEDWLWRICDHRGLRKKHFDEIEKTNHFSSTDSIQGRPLLVSRNYVIFSLHPSKTRVISNPPVVARHSRGKPSEEWEMDRFSQEVKAITLGRAEEANGRRRWLRIRNPQRAHRHIMFELPSGDAEDWKRDFLRLIGQR